MDNGIWQTYADAYAFFGNSLLKPLTQTETVGLDPAFWDAFPDFGDDCVAGAVRVCKAQAQRAQSDAEAGRDVVQNAAVEYTRLFVGPPSPAAPPWETMNREEGVTVGFGQPTFEMQEVLRGMGLAVGGESNQYADHMGIELLALSEMCSRAQVGEFDGADVSAFLEDRPLGWIDAFRAKVHEAFPGGYYDALLGLAGALMRQHRNALA